MTTGTPIIVCPRCRNPFRGELRDTENFNICPRCGYVITETEIEYA